jgi:hypothetical protein
MAFDAGRVGLDVRVFGNDLHFYFSFFLEGGRIHRTSWYQSHESLPTAF